MDIKSGYIHYYFSNFKRDHGLGGSTSQAYFDSLKRDLLSSQKLNAAVAVRKSKLTKNEEEAMLLLNSLTGQAGTEALESILDTNVELPTTTSSAKAIGDQSFASILYSRAFEDMDKFIPQAIEYQRNLNKVLADIAEQLNTTYPALQKRVLENFKNGTPGARELSGVALADKIVDELINNEGSFVGVKNPGRKNIDAMMQKLILTAEALKEAKGISSRLETVVANPSKRDARKANRKSKIMTILSARTAGWLNNAAGLAHEYATARALEMSVLQYLEAEDLLIQKAVSGGGQQLSKYKRDPELVALYKRLGEKLKQETSQSFKKEDVSFTVTNGSVTLTLGTSVKKTGPPKNGIYTVKLSSGMSILDTLYVSERLWDNKGFMNALFNSAAGHADTDGKKKGSVTSGSIESSWMRVVDTVGAAAFLHSLMGSGQGKGENAMFLVINRNVYSVDEILRLVISNPASVHATYSGIKGHKQEMTKKNRWLPARSASQRKAVKWVRSDRARDMVLQEMSAKRMEVKLSLPSGPATLR